MPITKSAFIRSTVLAILVGTLALLIIVGVSFWLVEQARIYSDAVTAARFERSAIADLRNMLDDAETGQRGYLLTSDQAYLTPYLDVRNRIPAQLDRVRALTDDDPLQKEAVAKKRRPPSKPCRKCEGLRRDHAGCKRYHEKSYAEYTYEEGNK